MWVYWAIRLGFHLLFGVVDGCCEAKDVLLGEFLLFMWFGVLAVGEGLGADWGFLEFFIYSLKPLNILPALHKHLYHLKVTCQLTRIITSTSNRSFLLYTILHGLANRLPRPDVICFVSEAHPPYNLDWVLKFMDFYQRRNYLHFSDLGNRVQSI